jgi:phosphoribosylformylglycinamidine synthase
MGQAATESVPQVRVHRIEVAAQEGRADVAADSLRRDAASIGIRLSAVRASHVYLIEAALDAEQVDAIRARLLTDPVTEVSAVGAPPAPFGAAATIEVHPLPGVMDPVAQTVREAIRELTGVEARVATGWRYDLAGPGLTRGEAERLASRFLANPVIHRIHHGPYHPASFPVGAPHDRPMRSVPLVGLGDEGLARLSREAHLFLSLEEMRAIQSHYRGLGRDPREIELETLAQTWSEHCVHKTLKSTVTYRERPGESAGRGAGAEGSARPAPARIGWEGRAGHTVNADGTVTIANLLRSTIAAATHELIRDGVDWTLSVFTDNAGVVAFDGEHAVCVKVETHNHPSAIEPYGGAATGVGGCIRDVIGTGLGARPIASTDVFCVAMPDAWSEGADGSAGAAARPLPPGALRPRRILTQVVAGVRDYGNRMGIPTVSGAVAFDDRYVGNPLVFCGCVGVMPRDRVRGRVRAGDLIVAVGGRTGRDGIHGATFSSAELEHTSADEFAHAVQIGNAIEEKRVLDAILRARDEGSGPDGAPLFTALTDCGAGGFSSAIGEMGRHTGAVVHLDRAPLKYAGLSPTEVWISEAQERMVLAVPAANLDALRRICAEESVEVAVLGEFRSPDGADGPTLLLLHRGEEVGRLSMAFLHDGLPTPRREAEWPPPAEAGMAGAGARGAQGRRPPERLAGALRALLSHPTVASKHWIIRQYDHEVRGGTVVKPLVGPASRGPSDASVVQPVPGTRRGLAVSQGMQTGVGDPAVGGDPYLMALAAVDECVRNLVCVGADASRVAILDNFCWPTCAKAHHLGALVRAAEGCYDAAKAYRTPFVSGKDSLNNQMTYTDPRTGESRTIEIPYTLLITGIGIIPDISRCVTMDAKRAGNVLLLVGGFGRPEMGGSIYQSQFGVPPGASAGVPRTDLALGPAAAGAVSRLIREGVAVSAHDVSDGGLLVSIAEMLIGATDGAGEEGALGVEVMLPAGVAPAAAAFAETPSGYVVEVSPADVGRALDLVGAVPALRVGRLTASRELVVAGEGEERVSVAALREAWLGPLDW